MDNYFKSWTELEGKLGDKPKFYNFDYDEYSSTYENFYNYAFENLKNVWDAYLMSKCYFYFYQKTKDFREPAYATRRKSDGTNIVGISKELIEYLSRTFLPYKDQRILIARANGTMFSQALAENLGVTLLNFSLQFIFHHEVAHIMQFDEKHIQYRAEGYADGGEGEFDEMSHILERDADALAANYLVRIVLGMWGIDENRNRTKNLPPELLETLMAIMLSSVFILFDYFSQSMKRPFYTYSGDHPHPAIRMSDFLALSLDLLKQLNVAPVSEINIVQITVDSLDQLGKGQFSRQWNSIVQARSNEIYVYKKTIREKSEQFNWLCTPIMKKFVKDQEIRQYHFYSVKCWLSKENCIKGIDEALRPIFTKSMKSRIPLKLGKKLDLYLSDNNFPSYPYIVEKLVPSAHDTVVYAYLDELKTE